MTYNATINIIQFTPTVLDSFKEGEQYLVQLILNVKSMKEYWPVVNDPEACFVHLILLDNNVVTLSFDKSFTFNEPIKEISIVIRDKNRKWLEVFENTSFVTYLTEVEKQPEFELPSELRLGQKVILPSGGVALVDSISGDYVTINTVHSADKVHAFMETYGYHYVGPRIQSHHHSAHELPNIWITYKRNQ